MLQGSHFRAHTRLAVDLGAILRGNAEEWEQEVRIVNLGLDGARIELGDLLEPDSSITLQIVAPTLWDPLVLRGRVVWARQSGGKAALAGLQFRNQQPAPIFALLELLSAHSYEQG